MKNHIALALLASIIISCSQPSSEQMDAVEEAPNEAINYNYTGNFNVLPMDQYDVVGRLFEEIENQNLSVISEVFADSVSLHFADGSIYEITNDSLQSMMSYFFSEVAESNLIEHAGLVVEAPDQGHTWVLSWNSEFMTRTDGSTSNDVYQENFLIENGKIRAMRQYKQELDDSIILEEEDGFTYSGEFSAAADELRKVVYDWNMKLSQDNPDFAGVENLLADSVTVYFADGSMMNQTKGEMMEEVKTIIGSFQDVDITFDAMSVVKANNTGETWVLSWTREKFTGPEGEVEDMFIHEDYMLEDGKIRLVRQYRMNAASE